MANVTQGNGGQGPCAECRIPIVTVDDCYNLTVRKLTGAGKIQDVSSEFATCNSNFHRLLHAYHILKELDIFPNIRKNTKNNNVAVYYRCEGNKYYKQKKNYEALQCYNLSLLYAEPKTEHFVFAISNRSAALYDIGNYQECLDDINYVFSSEYPEKIQAKLMERKQKCLSMIEAEEAKCKDDSNYIKVADIMNIKGPRNEKYPCASAKLKVVYNKEMGRHVIANEDIKVGEVLVEEEPYLTVLLKNQYLFCCSHCLSRKWNLYPCLNCPYILYCSNECRVAAEKQYHNVECTVMSALVGMDFTKLELLALRTVIKSYTDFNDWNDTLITAETAESTVNSSTWGCVKVNNQWVYNSKHYASIHTLATNVEKRSVSDLFRKAVTGAVLFRLLAMMQFIKSDSMEKLEKVFLYVGGALMTHLMTSPTNMHSISANTQNADGNYVEELNVASGVYAFLSLINHSCSPNVVRYRKLGTTKMCLIAIRPIKKGQQIFDNYGAHHALQNLQTRQSNLLFQYKFKCTCEACVNDWPQHGNLNEGLLPASILIMKIKLFTPNVIDKLMAGDLDIALKCFKPLCDLITVLEPYAPCVELAESQESLKQCLAIFQGSVPYIKQIEWQPHPPCEALGLPHDTEYLNLPVPDFGVFSI